MIIYSYSNIDFESTIKEQDKLKKFFELLKDCTYYGPNGVVYSTDRYELVEKKDWKIKQLKADIERFKENLEQNKKDNEVLAKEYNKLIKAIAYAEKELKELEK